MENRLFFSSGIGLFLREILKQFWKLAQDLHFCFMETGNVSAFWKCELVLDKKMDFAATNWREFLYLAEKKEHKLHLSEAEGTQIQTSSKRQMFNREVN